MNENHSILTEDVLVAFVDRELPAEQAAAVAAALAQDAEARETVRRLRVSADMVKRVSLAALDEPVPLALVEGIQARIHGASRKRQRWYASTLPMALAASIVALVLGANVGYMARDLSSGGYIKAEAPGSDALASSYEATLEGSLSSGAATGQSFDYDSPGIGQGKITLGSSFTTGFGSNCREFAREETRGGVQASGHGIACRAQNGTWNVLFMREDS